MRKTGALVWPKTVLAICLRFLTGMLVCTAFMVASRDASAQSTKPVLQRSIEQVAKQALPSGAELQHKVVNVDLGALGKTIVVFYKGREVLTNFSGAVLIPETGSNSFRFTGLPPIREADGLFDFEIVSVFGLNKDNVSRALVVIYRYIRLGTGEGYKYSGYVYSHDGKEWHIDDRRSRLLVDVSTAVLAKKKLTLHAVAR